MDQTAKTFVIRDPDLARDKPALLSFILGSQRFEYDFEPNRRLDPPVADEYFAKVLDQLAKQPGQIFVVEAGEPIGWGVVFEMQDDVYVEAKERRTAYIAELFVEEAWRGKGVGRALIAACEDWAKARGIGIVLIGVLPGNVRAHAIYTQAGYGPYSLQLRKRLA